MRGYSCAADRPAQIPINRASSSHLFGGMAEGVVLEVRNERDRGDPDQPPQNVWWDFLEGGFDLHGGIFSARRSLHPDAQWFASLLPAGEPVAGERAARDDILRALKAQGDDPPGSLPPR